MLTFVESLSLAGDRSKQNDDLCGFSERRAWMIDGATDLHAPSLTGAASDAAWIAAQANAFFAAHEESDLAASVRDAAIAARSAFLNKGLDIPEGEARWQSPIASLLMVQETEAGVEGLDLGDCRLFAFDANGVAHPVGGPPQAADRESQMASEAAKRAGNTPLLRDEATLDLLRRGRAQQNRAGGSWTFGLDPDCAAHARVWTLALARPAYVLLCTDGFSALTDRYAKYDAGQLVRSCVDNGLHEAGRVLRSIETEDAGGARHPRWKRSDDATALLMRLS